MWQPPRDTAVACYVLYTQRIVEEASRKIAQDIVEEGGIVNDLLEKGDIDNEISSDKDAGRPLHKVCNISEKQKGDFGNIAE
jgi:uncharacterized protein (UPF0248 family)